MLVCLYRTVSVYSSIVLDTSMYYSNFDIYYNSISRIILYSISRNFYTRYSYRQMVLDLLIWIRSYLDRTLVFRSSCCEGVCGSCAMLINNLNTLACIQPIWLIDSYIIIYPLPHLSIIRDLVVDLKHFYEQYFYINPFYTGINSDGFNDLLYSMYIYFNTNQSFFINSYVNYFFYFQFLYYIVVGSVLYCNYVYDLYFFQIYIYSML